MTTHSFTNPKLAHPPTYIIVTPNGEIFSDYGSTSKHKYAQSFYRVTWFDSEEKAKKWLAEWRCEGYGLLDAKVVKVTMSFEVVP